MTSHVTETDAASPDEAFAHFSNRLRFETDCWDVFDSGQNGTRDYVLVDVRGEGAYARGHVPGAINLPRRDMGEANLGGFSLDTLFVVYCAGPHCNGANKAAVLLAGQGRRVKEMIGGVTGWLDEGFTLETGDDRTVVTDLPDSEAATLNLTSA